MKKHLLLTISDDPSALYGLRFVNDFFQDKSQVKFTVFYIAPSSSQQSQSVHSDNSDTCELALEKSFHNLLNAGFLEEQILCKIKKRVVSTAKDIIYEGNRGLYDAIILGRRGVSRFEELINDSVSIKVLEEKRKSPIWICRQIETNRKDVLVCLDGSDESLRMVDHVGFFIRDEEQHNITLFHVNQNSTDTDTMFSQAIEILFNHGLKKNRINTKEVESSNIVSTIEKESKSGNFSAVAVGYTGSSKRGLFTIGSVATKLFYNITGSALWIG